MHAWARLPPVMAQGRHVVSHFVGNFVRAAVLACTAAAIHGSRAAGSLASHFGADSRGASGSHADHLGAGVSSTSRPEEDHVKCIPEHKVVACACPKCG